MSLFDEKWQNRCNISSALISGDIQPLIDINEAKARYIIGGNLVCSYDIPA